MRSLGDRWRPSFEHAMRAIALGALGMLLWQSVRPPPAREATVAAGDPLPHLARWTADPPREAHLILTSAPDPRGRDWLRALASTGTVVRWSADSALGDGAVAAEPVPQPSGGTRVRIAAPGDGAGGLALGDEAGPIDSVAPARGATIDLGTVVSAVRVSGDRFTARAAVRDSVVLRPVLVLGSAGWETKFTVAALEERGWAVAARMRVAPAVEVTQGPLGSLDTARYSAVIALDSAAAPLAGAIARFAASGGGVVLAGTTAGLPGLAAIAPGRPGARAAGVAGAVASAAPRAGLALAPIVSLRADALPLERRGALVAAAARRAGLGRVVQLGYDDTWRWRMAGADGSVQAHRDWWSAVVSSVAYAAVSPPAMSPAPDDEAPVASLVAALGAPSPRPAALATADPVAGRRRSAAILFTLVAMSLFLEWASRRFRGAR